MPIYAYQCAECGHDFDRLQKLSEPDPVDCPACGRAGLRRKVTAPSFRLAGSGWYETDFKSGSDRKRNLAGDAGGGGTEAKPAAEAASSGSGSTPAAAPKPAAGGSTAA